MVSMKKLVSFIVVMSLIVCVSVELFKLVIDNSY